MTPDRWLQIDDLFDTAIRLDPAERGDWLRRACGDDDDLGPKSGNSWPRTTGRPGKGS